MKFDQALENSRWEILAELSKGEQSASDISRKNGASISNISQQMTLLNAFGLIKAQKESKKGIGKPRTIYTLAKDLAHIAVIRNGFAQKRTLVLDPHSTTMLKILLCERAEDRYFLERYLWSNDDFLSDTEGVALIESKEDEMHVLIIVEEKLLDDFRKKYSKTVVKHKGMKRNIIAWTHSEDELRAGLEQKESYFVNMLRKPYVLFEKEDVFQELTAEKVGVSGGKK